MTLVEEFDAVLSELPSDWAFFECYVAVRDPLRLGDARVALARANGRPVKHGPSDHDVEVTVANTRGRGASAGVVRGALRVLDDLGVAGRVWCGDVRDLVLDAPAHRYGP